MSFTSTPKKEPRRRKTIKPPPKKGFFGLNIIGSLVENIGIVDVFDKQINMKGVEFALMSESEKNAIRHKLFKKQKRYDIVQLFTALTGMTLACIEAWFYYSQTMKIDDEGNRYQITELESPILMTLRSISSVLAFFAVFATVMRYKIHLQLMKIEEKIKFDCGMRKAGLIPNIIFESLQLIIHAPPGANFTIGGHQQNKILYYSFDTIIAVFTLSRIYLVYKVFALYSKWNSQFVNKKCSEYHAEGGINFALKAELNRMPYVMISISSALTIVIFGFAICILERPYVHASGLNWDYIWNGMWNTIITSATVGYGDFYPRTHLGRFVLSICMVIGTFLISLAVVALTNSARFNKSEDRSYNNLVAMRNRITLMELSNSLIISTCKYYNTLRGRYPSKLKPQNQYAYRKLVYEDFKNKMIEFTSFRKSFVANESSISVDEISDRAKAMIYSQLAIVKFSSQRAQLLQQLIQDILNENNNIYRNAEDLYSYSCKMYKFAEDRVKELTTYTQNLKTNIGYLMKEPDVYVYDYVPAVKLSVNAKKPAESKVRREGRRNMERNLKRIKSRMELHDPSLKNEKPDNDVEIMVIAQKAMKNAFKNFLNNIAQKKLDKKDKGLNTQKIQQQKLPIKESQDNQKLKITNPKIPLLPSSDSIGNVFDNSKSNKHNPNLKLVRNVSEKTNASDQHESAKKPINEHLKQVDRPKIQRNLWIQSNNSLNPISGQMDMLLDDRMTTQNDDKKSETTISLPSEQDEQKTEREKVLDRINKQIYANERHFKNSEKIDNLHPNSIKETQSEINKNIQLITNRNKNQSIGGSRKDHLMKSSITTTPLISIRKNTEEDSFLQMIIQSTLN